MAKKQPIVITSKLSAESRLRRLTELLQTSAGRLNLAAVVGELLLKPWPDWLQKLVKDPAIRAVDLAAPVSDPTGVSLVCAGIASQLRGELRDYADGKELVSGATRRISRQRGRNVVRHDAGLHGDDWVVTAEDNLTGKPTSATEARLLAFLHKDNPLSASLFDLLLVGGESLKRCGRQGCLNVFIPIRRQTYCSRRCSGNQQSLKYRSKNRGKINQKRHNAYVQQVARQKGISELEAHRLVVSRPRGPKSRKRGSGG